MVELPSLQSNHANLEIQVNGGDKKDSALVNVQKEEKVDLVVPVVVDTSPVKEPDPWALPDLEDDAVPWKELKGKQKVGRICSGIWKCLAILALLYSFVCSLDFLSSALRLVGGKQASEALSQVELLKNPVVGVMLGVIATVVLQSSSTSTSIVITMVGSGLLEVRNSVPIIMGANIGTSVTNTLASFSQISERNRFRRAFAAATVHDMFNWLTVIVLLPIEVATGYLEELSRMLIETHNWEHNMGTNKVFLTVITKPFTSLIIQLDKKVLESLAVNSTGLENVSLMKQCCVNETEGCSNCGYLMLYIGMSDVGTGILMLMLSLVLLCTCLYLIVKILKSVLKGKIAQVIKKVVNAEPRFPFNHFVGYIAILVGCGMTILVQSSSIFTSALTPLAGIGVITVERMYPLTLGSNVGTTTTGILAALASSPERLQYALQLAFCHLFFNISGILLFYPIPFMRFPVPLSKKLGSITAKYRWFSLFYLLMMFLVLPMFVLGFSMAGSDVFMGVGIPLLCCIGLVIVINVLQRKRPSWLPPLLRNWNWLPEWMRSLDTIDRCLVKFCHMCKCCSCCVQPQSKVNENNDGLRSIQSKANILDSRSSSSSEFPGIISQDNSAFAFNAKSQITKL